MGVIKIFEVNFINLSFRLRKDSQGKTQLDK